MEHKATFIKVETKLSVIIPFRMENEESQYLFTRLEDLLNQAPHHLPIEFMVCDSGSKPKYQKKIKALCEKYKVTYLFHNSLGKTFSIGAARDYGVQHAKGETITFLDVDLRVSPDFWERLFILIDSWGVNKFKKSFLAIPCLYLSREGTAEFLASGKNKFTDFYLRYLQGDKSSVETLALCSSVMIVNRYHYLSIGGHDIAFKGHGYEDFELYHRLITDEGIIPRPDNYYLDQKTFDTVTYNGFRSHLTLIARPALMLNLFVVHLWHPRPKTASFYQSNNMVQNRNLWIEKFKEFVETNKHPLPLPILSENQKREKTLFFGIPNDNAANCWRDASIFFGDIIYVSEYEYTDCNGELKEKDFLKSLKNLGITRVFFPNPYGNPVRLAIYKLIKDTYPITIFERGALPDSWFFDANGFNADSSTYTEEHWNKKLTEEELEFVEHYIQETIMGGNELESQKGRVGADVLATQLRIGGKKVLFVPLQRPSDTVIKYFSGNIGSFTKFVQVIDQIAEKLKSQGWVVLVKKHPLETEHPQFHHAKYVADDVNFLDLLELSNHVALINSGVGIYSMMMEKPTLLFGNAFYAFDGINQTIPVLDFNKESEIDILCNTIVSEKPVETQKMYKFINHLINSVYSFGKVKTYSRKEKDGSLRTITSNVDFYDLKINGKSLFKFSNTKRPNITINAPLFERYALDLHQKKRLKKG